MPDLKAVKAGRSSGAVVPFAKGDRVRVEAPKSALNGRVGVVTVPRPWQSLPDAWCFVMLDGEADEMVFPKTDLVKLGEQKT